MDFKTAILHYCNYQDRSHKEVRNKLYELGCKAKEVEEYLTDLITSGLLNEERYARSITRGKFRIKQWGRNKIVQHLKAQNISSYCIKNALTEINPQEYILTLKMLSEKKWVQMKAERNYFKKKSKLYKYLLHKGFESDLIADIIQEIIETE